MGFNSEFKGLMSIVPPGSLRFWREFKGKLCPMPRYQFRFGKIDIAVLCNDNEQFAVTVVLSECYVTSRL